MLQRALHAGFWPRFMAYHVRRMGVLNALGGYNNVNEV